MQKKFTLINKERSAKRSESDCPCTQRKIDTRIGGGDDGARTRDLPACDRLLWPTELHPPWIGTQKRPESSETFFTIHDWKKVLEDTAGLEPATFCHTSICSIQLSYASIYVLKSTEDLYINYFCLMSNIFFKFSNLLNMLRMGAFIY